MILNTIYSLGGLSNLLTAGQRHPRIAMMAIQHKAKLTQNIKFLFPFFKASIMHSLSMSIVDSSIISQCQEVGQA